MSRRSFITGIGLVVVAAAAVVTAASAVASIEPQQRNEVLIAHGDDRLPSTSATDWVTYADHVVAVQAVSERASALTSTELERGEGLLGRTVHLRVTDVLWSRDNAHAAPTTWQYRGTGWTFTDGDPDNRTPVALAEQPRIEPGHRYVLAISWVPAR